MNNSSFYVEQVHTILTAWAGPKPFVTELTVLAERELRDLKKVVEGTVFVQPGGRVSGRDSRSDLTNDFGVVVAVAAYVEDYEYATLKPWVDFVDAMLEHLKVETTFISSEYDPYLSTPEIIEQCLFYSSLTLGFRAVQ